MDAQIGRSVHDFDEERQSYCTKLDVTGLSKYTPRLTKRGKLKFVSMVKYGSNAKGPTPRFGLQTWSLKAEAKHSRKWRRFGVWTLFENMCVKTRRIFHTPNLQRNAPFKMKTRFWQEEGSSSRAFDRPSGCRKHNKVELSGMFSEWRIELCLEPTNTYKIYKSETSLDGGYRTWWCTLILSLVVRSVCEVVEHSCGLQGRKAQSRWTAPQNWEKNSVVSQTGSVKAVLGAVPPWLRHANHFPNDLYAVVVW